MYNNIAIIQIVYQFESIAKVDSFYFDKVLISYTIFQNEINSATACVVATQGSNQRFDKGEREVPGSQGLSPDVGLRSKPPGAGYKIWM